MEFSYISLNGVVVPAEKAVVPVNQTEVAYGFGVYETIKVRNNCVYFVEQHIERLLHSAEQIGLLHVYTTEWIANALNQLLAKLDEPSCNIKIVLYGASQPENAQMFILPSAPLYPDRKWYRDGVSLISFEHERWMPQAKTLNMLPSYYMYTKAKQMGCYDALLFNSKGNALEGTRTNMCVIKGTHIFSPPKKDILEGVTMMTLEKVLKNTEYTIEYKDISMASIWEYDGMFLSSTSTKIMPVKKVDDKEYPMISEQLANLIYLYESALDTCGGDFNKL